MILSQLKRDGVKLVVEIDLSFEQFRKLLEIGLGCQHTEEQVAGFAAICHRRILPTDSGSYSGIGFDINCLLKALIDGDKQ